ncbi:hypothetical protein MTO96_048242 [Rhipicephalus appendiculatus]
MQGTAPRSSPLDVTPVDQDRVMLSCLASQFKYENLTWMWKPNGSSQLVSLIPNSDLDVKMSSTAFSNNLTLYFNPISKNQSGEYHCFGSIRGGRAPRSIGFADVAVRDMRPPEFIKTNLHNDVLSHIDLQCSATGLPKPSISWLKDGKPLNTTGIDRFDDGRWIVKQKVTPEDSGFYQCSAENRAGVIYANTTISVASGKKSEYSKREEEDTLFDKGQVDMFNPDLPLCDQVELLPYDRRWEFPKDRLKLGRTLGQGAFGRVVKAQAIGIGDQGKPLTVAVKMLKERADMSQRKALMAELKILILLGRHLNIVNIIGAVTKNVARGELMVMVEYCKFGNMRHYLLRHRARFVNQLKPSTGKLDPDMCYSPKSPPSTSPGFRLAISNPVYCGNNTTVTSGSSLRDHGDMHDAALTTCDLLCFAFQVARGMEYLASRKSVHNEERCVVLRGATLGDILSRRQPLSWSCHRRVLSTKRLKNGYRMEKPDYAPDDVYEIMQSCWQGQPEERPDFSTLVTRVGDFLEAGVRNEFTLFHPVFCSTTWPLNDPYDNVNRLMKNNNDYLTMGNNLDPDYLDMRSDDENSVNTSRTTAQPSAEPHYAKMAATTANVDDGSATVEDSMEMAPMIGSAGDRSQVAEEVTQGYMNIGKGPTLQLRLPQGKRRYAPPPLLPPSGGSSGDARASDDVSESCATPPPAYNLVMSVVGSGSIEV